MAGRFSVETVFKAIDRITRPVSRMQARLGKFVRAVNKGLKTVNNTVDKTIYGIGRMGKAVLKFGAAGVGILTASVALLVREFSKVENAEAAFTPLLGGVKKAKELVQALNDTAALTPFQFEHLASQASQLLPVMNGDIQNTIDTIRMLGDTAGGNAQKLDSITRGFTKAMLKGKVDMESLNMIAEAGVPIFTELADSMGVKVNAAFFKMISAGKVTTTHLTKAFKKMTTQGGVFFNGMQIASETTTGLWSTLKDNISLTAAELGGVLAPVVKDLIRQATDVAKRIRAWVIANKELISTRFNEFVEKGKTAIIGLYTSVMELNAEQNLLTRLGEIIVGVADAFRFMGEHGATILTVTAWLLGLVAVLKIITGVVAVFNLVVAANPIVLLVLAVVALVGILISAVKWSKELISWFENMGPAIRVLLAPLELLVRTIQAFKDVGSAAFRWFSDHFNIGGSDRDEDKNGQAGGQGGVPADNLGVAASAQVISPQERVARSIEEHRDTNTAEVTIKDETGQADVTGGRLGAGVTLQSTGEF